MLIAEVKLSGKIERGQLIPDVFAIISRIPGRNQIDISIVTAAGEKEHHVQADCEEDVWSMAECLQYHLDGHHGTNSDIHGYYRILGYFMD